VGIGDWAQSPIPNPQSPFYYNFLINLLNNIYIIKIIKSINK